MNALMPKSAGLERMPTLLWIAEYPGMGRIGFAATDQNALDKALRAFHWAHGPQGFVPDLVRVTSASMLPANGRRYRGDPTGSYWYA